MISWRSYTTSKVLPTFVGESGKSSSSSRSWSHNKGFDYRGDFYGERSESYSGSTTEDRTRKVAGSFSTGTVSRYSRLSDASGNLYRGNEFSHWGPNGQEAYGLGGLESTTVVSENSTIISNPRFTWDEYGENIGVTTDAETKTAPLQVVKQETTKTVSYQRNIRSTETISAYTYGGDDDEGGVQEIEPLGSFVWITTMVEITLANGDKSETKSVEQHTTNATTTVVKNVTTRATRTVVTVEDEELSFKTYTAVDGNVEVVWHRIFEAHPDAVGAYNWRTYATVNSPQSEVAVTELSFAPTRFTMSFSEEYTSTLDIRDTFEKTLAVTTKQTNKPDHATTRVGVTNETYKAWYNYEYEERECPTNPALKEYKTSLKSYQANFNKTYISEYTTNTTTSTFETFNGVPSSTFTRDYTTGDEPIRDADGNYPPAVQMNRTFYPENTTVTRETTAFSISGDILLSSSYDWPGIVETRRFPWETYGDGHKKFINRPNEEFVLINTTSQITPFEHTVDLATEIETQGSWPEREGGIFGDYRGGGGASESAAAWQTLKEGAFYNKQSPGFANTSGHWLNFIEYNLPDVGLADPALSFQTKNNHSSVGGLMEAGAQHTWVENTWNNFEIGLISEAAFRRVVGAMPLYPTFTGIVKDNDKWTLCETSKYTTISGSRIGRAFSTTAVWQTVDGTETKNTTISGTFEVKSISSRPIEAAHIQFAGRYTNGGFRIPNNSFTHINSPGVIHKTTYDAAQSGTISTSFSKATTEKSAIVGQAPITIAETVRRYRGMQIAVDLSLVDNGLP